VEFPVAEAEHARIPVILSAPLSVTLELTSRCNFRCVHCYARRNPRDAIDTSESEMTTRKILGFLEEISRLHVWWLTMTGGEPLIRQDFFQIASYAKSKGLIQTLMTNGSLITPRAAERIHRYFRTVQISIDAADADTFSLIRRSSKQDFEKVLDGVRNLVASGCTPIISVTVFKQNLDQLEQIIELALSLGCNKVRFGQVTPVSRGDRNWNQIVVDPYVTTRRVKELTESYQGKVFTDFQDPVKMVAAYEQYLSAGEYRRSFCAAGTWHCAVDSKGNVLPCPIFVEGEFSAGNVGERPFSEIWADPHTFQFFRDFKNSVEAISTCSKCRYKLVCGGLCRASAFACGRTIFSSPPYCPLVYMRRYPESPEGRSAS